MQFNQAVIHQPTTFLLIDRLAEKAWIKVIMLEQEVDALAPMRAYLKETGYDKRLSLVEGTTDVVKIEKYQELLPQDVTKGTGVIAPRKLPEYAGRTFFAVGDYWNDLVILQSVDEPCAPANAADEGKAVCRHLLPSRNDSPIARLIHEVIPKL